MFRVRFGVTLKSSCAKRPIRFCSWVKGAVSPPLPFCPTRSSRKSENANPVKAPV